MKKTGWYRLPDFTHIQKQPRCANCGGVGKYQVTFEDMFAKMTVTLCEECEKLGYGELKLQTVFPWGAVI